jgi:hypothetical protein
MRACYTTAARCLAAWPRGAAGLPGGTQRQGIAQPRHEGGICRKQRLARTQPWQCPCEQAAAGPGGPRMHTFWQCLVAQALRLQLQLGLGGAAQLRRAHIWAMEPPAAAGLTQQLWSVVAVAAVDAMESGRAALWCARHAEPARPPADQQRAADLVAGACRGAAARFWACLAQVAEDLRGGGAELSLDPSADCPFLCVAPDGRLMLRLPA